MHVCMCICNMYTLFPSNEIMWTDSISEDVIWIMFYIKYVVCVFYVIYIIHGIDNNDI